MLDFCNAIEDAVAGEQTQPFEAGTSIMDLSMPDVWDANFLRVERSGVMDVSGLVDAAERIQGGAGLSHRAVGVDEEAEGRRLEPGFLELGWTVERDLFMILRRAPDEPAKPVEHVGDQSVASLRLAQLLEIGDMQEDAAVGLRQVESRIDATQYGSGWFVAPPDAPASTCRLLTDGTIGQVEDVATLESERGKGHATAVINAALQASVTARHDLTFLIADHDDWVKDLYAKLGFEPAALAYQFRRVPTQE